MRSLLDVLSERYELPEAHGQAQATSSVRRVFNRLLGRICDAVHRLGHHFSGSESDGQHGCLPWNFHFEPLEQRQLLAAAPIINEFMARNDGGLRDGDGRTSDWIEI